MFSNLQEIKKELRQLDTNQLLEICLRMAKYKKENKELLSYLIFDAGDPLSFAESIKSDLLPEFKNLNRHYYYSTKTLRKILRVISRYSKYTANKQVEIELLIWFCSNFLTYADTHTSHKPLKALFIRQLEKISKLLVKLHEDLQFDYRNEFDHLIRESVQKIRGFSLKDLNVKI